jgi:hypothetical protein
MSAARSCRSSICQIQAIEDPNLIGAEATTVTSGQATLVERTKSDVQGVTHGHHGTDEVESRIEV